MNKCLHCGKKTNNPKFCSRNCSAIYNNKKFPKRAKSNFCKNCKKLIGKNRKYCSELCSAEGRKKENVEKWLRGDLTGGRGKGGYQLSAVVRNYLLEKSEYKCSKCGWGEINPFSGKVPLEIDHIDGNWKNNKPENLMVLCPNCHSLTETYRALNSGKGRGSEMRGSRLYKNN